MDADDALTTATLSGLQQHLSTEMAAATSARAAAEHLQAQLDELVDHAAESPEAMAHAAVSLQQVCKQLQSQVEALQRQLAQQAKRDAEDMEALLKLKADIEASAPLPPLLPVHVPTELQQHAQQLQAWMQHMAAVGLVAAGSEHQPDERTLALELCRAQHLAEQLRFDLLSLVLPPLPAGYPIAAGGGPLHTPPGVEAGAGARVGGS